MPVLGEIMRYGFSELVDIQSIRGLISCFYKITKVSCGIGVNGTILTASSWHSICGNFHRRNPRTRLRCIESDTDMSSKVLRDRQYVVCNCKNGLIDAAAPVFVRGEHVADVFTGQFFLSTPDVGRFRKQAREFGFDETTYLAALRKVPVLERNSVEAVLEYLSHFAELLGELGLHHLKQLEAEEALRVSEARYKFVFEKTVEGIIQAAGYLLEQTADGTHESANGEGKRGKFTLPRPAISNKMIAGCIAGLASSSIVGLEMTPCDRVTPRQREVLQLIALGFTTKEIARKMSVSVNTVEVHRANLMERLNIHDIAGLVRYAIRMGIISCGS